tara:strand:- start:5078 stop:5377 length:300 start_codon:yes stop_codon:yes gene_type:complete
MQNKSIKQRKTKHNFYSYPQSPYKDVAALRKDLKDYDIKEPRTLNLSWILVGIRSRALDEAMHYSHNMMLNDYKVVNDKFVRKSKKSKKTKKSRKTRRR